MDIGRSFTYMFEDPRWIAKLAIGGGILLLGALPSFLLGIVQAAIGDSSSPVRLLCSIAILIASLLSIVTSLIASGYSLTTIRNVAEGSNLPLPEWSNVGAFFRKGLLAGIGSFVIFLPFILIVCCFVAVTALIASAGSDRSGAASAIGVFSVCAFCIAFLYALVAGVYLNAAMPRYALNDQISTFWDFRGNLQFIQANLGNFVVALLLTIAASFVGSLGLIVCGVGVAFTGFWANLVSAHLFGQVLRGGSASTDYSPMAPLSPPPMMPTAPM